jgi:hypothetical protein
VRACVCAWTLSAQSSPPNQRWTGHGNVRTVETADSLCSLVAARSVSQCRLQVWSVCYNSTGTKALSAADDGSLFLYHCP